MTRPNPTPAPGTPKASTIDPVAADSLQNALAAEHAALWCYALTVAFLAPEQRTRARADADAHRELRGAIETTLNQIGVRPISALPAYAVPNPVVDGATAAALAVTAETDALAAWRGVMEHTIDKGLRKAALDALTDGTLRLAKWRVDVGTPPAIPAFPGRG